MKLITVTLALSVLLAGCDKDNGICIYPKRDACAFVDTREMCLDPNVGGVGQFIPAEGSDRYGDRDAVGTKMCHDRGYYDCRSTTLLCSKYKD
jgi:hypothetical protein